MAPPGPPNGKKDKICFLIKMVKHLNCIGKKTSPWLGYVKGTLEKCGLNSVWMSHVQSGSGVSRECQGLSRLCVQRVIWTPRTMFFDSLDTQEFLSEFADDDFS